MGARRHVKKPVVPGKDKLKAYWKVTNAKFPIGTAIRLSSKVRKLSAADIVGCRGILGLEEGYVPDERTISRVLKDGAPRDAGHLLGLMLIARDVLSRELNQTGEIKEILESFAGHVTTLRGILGGDFPKVRGLAETITPPPIVDVVGLLRQFLQVPSEAFDAMNHEFFPNIDLANLPPCSAMLFFNMYRFHSEPKKIVKTFTVIKSPIVARPFAMYSNFFVSGDPENARRSEGIIIPTKDFLYLLGGVNKGTGLKLVALERRAHGIGDVRHGLTITFDENETMVAARCIFVPTKAQRHEEAGANVYPMDKIETEVQGFVEQLRNRVSFELEETIKVDGTPKSWDAMVHALGDILGGLQKPRIVFEDGRAFNPADPHSFPFNAALKAWPSR